MWRGVETPAQQQRVRTVACLSVSLSLSVYTQTHTHRLDEEANIQMFERGPYVSFANCGLPYFVGNVIEVRVALRGDEVACAESEGH